MSQKYRRVAKFFVLFPLFFIAVFILTGIKVVEAFIIGGCMMLNPQIEISTEKKTRIEIWIDRYCALLD